MVTSSDQAYKKTKRIKQGTSALVAPFDALATWISKKWSVGVLNVIYDRRNSLHAPRLQVILEHEHETKKFLKAAFNFDPRKQSAIASKFIELTQEGSVAKYDVDGLFVVFSAFAPIAIEEAHSEISDEQIESLKRQIGNPDLWAVDRCFGRVTFFFHTDAQVAKYEKAGKRPEYASHFYEILKPHDEFGYLSREHFDVKFDSKQNLGENFQGNWFYYYK